MDWIEIIGSEREEFGRIGSEGLIELRRIGPDRTELRRKGRERDELGRIGPDGDEWRRLGRKKRS